MIVSPDRGLIASGQDPARLICIGDCGGDDDLDAVPGARRRPSDAGGEPVRMAQSDTSGYAPEYAGRRDPFVSVGWVHTTSRAYVGPGGDLTNPYVSPGHGDPTGLPPLLLQVGEVDVNRRDTEAFALRARWPGVGYHGRYDGQRPWVPGYRHQHPRRSRPGAGPPRSSRAVSPRAERAFGNSCAVAYLRL